jgi:hypothetical protein
MIPIAMPTPPAPAPLPVPEPETRGLPQGPRTVEVIRGTQRQTVNLTAEGALDTAPPSTPGGALPGDKK